MYAGRVTVPQPCSCFNETVCEPRQLALSLEPTHKVASPLASPSPCRRGLLHHALPPALCAPEEIHPCLRMTSPLRHPFVAARHQPQHTSTAACPPAYVPSHTRPAALSSFRVVVLRAQIPTNNAP